MSDDKKSKDPSSIFSEVFNTLSKAADSFSEMTNPALYNKALNTFKDAQRQAKELGINEIFIKDAEESIEYAKKSLAEEKPPKNEQTQKELLTQAIQTQTQLLIFHINSAIANINKEKEFQAAEEQKAKLETLKQFEELNSTHQNAIQSLEMLSNEIDTFIKPSPENLQDSEMKTLKKFKTEIDNHLIAIRKTNFSNTEQLQESIEKSKSFQTRGKEKLTEAKIDQLLNENTKLNSQKQPHQNRIKIFDKEILSKKSFIDNNLQGLKKHLEECHRSKILQQNNKIEKNLRNTPFIQTLAKGINGIVTQFNEKFHRNVPKLLDSFNQKKDTLQKEITALSQKIKELSQAGTYQTASVNEKKDTLQKEITTLNEKITELDQAETYQTASVQKSESQPSTLFNFQDYSTFLVSVNTDIRIPQTTREDVNLFDDNIKSTLTELQMIEQDKSIDEKEVKKIDSKITANEEKIKEIKQSNENKSQQPSLKNDKENDLTSFSAQHFKSLH